MRGDFDEDELDQDDYDFYDDDASILLPTRGAAVTVRHVPHGTRGLRPCLEPGCPTLTRQGRCLVHARGRERQRDTDAPWRAWYGTARWQALRRQVLSEEPTCRTCRAEDFVTAATEVDHIVKHDGDPLRFWDRDNLAGLCASCHAKKTRAGE